MGTALQVLVGAPATFKIASYLSGRVTSLTYTDVGYTSGGVTIDPKIELQMVNVDQALGNLAAIPKARDLELKVKFAEATIANLQFALAQPTANLSGTQALFIDASAPEIYYQLQVVGKGIGGAGVVTTRTVTLWKGYIKDMGAWSFKKDGAQEFDVTYGICEETTGTTGGTFMRDIES